MAYKKRYTKKRYTKKGKGAKDKTVTIWSDHNVLEKANRALNLANQMYRYINVEIKHHDVTQVGTAIPSTGNIIGLAAVPQGDAFDNRDGSSIKVLNLTSRMSFVSSVSATSGTLVRLILFRGKQENGVGYSATDILEAATVHSPKNYTDRFRTKILMDQTFALNNQSTSHALTRFMTKVQKLQGHVSYDDATTNIEDGGLYMLQLSNQGVNTPNITAHHRLTFTDN